MPGLRRRDAGASSQRRTLMTVRVAPSAFQNSVAVRPCPCCLYLVVLHSLQGGLPTRRPGLLSPPTIRVHREPNVVPTSPQPGLFLFPPTPPSAKKPKIHLQLATAMAFGAPPLRHRRQVKEAAAQT
jgi:hypothetical protein